MKHILQRILSVSIILTILLASLPLYAKDDLVIRPAAPGVYIKAGKTLARLIPNIVFDEQGLLYVESNNPPRFLLKNIEYFVFYGQYNIKYLTLNPLVFYRMSPVGKSRFKIGKDIEIDIKKTGEEVYVVRPKTLLGRGYHALWIEDTVWDFIIE